MSEIAEIESTELITLPARELALQVYSTPGGLDPLIDEIRDKVAGQVYDMTTRKGRDECASDAYKVARSKSAIEKLGAALSAQYKEIPKKIDAERRRAKEALEALQAQVRQPLTQWEAAEEARVERLKSKVQFIRDFAVMADDLSAAGIQVQINNLQTVTVDEQLEEYEAEAHRAKARALEILTAALVVREKYEADQNELARLREEAEARRIQDEKDRIAREAAERATREAEAKAQAEREAAEKREADAKAAQAKAEQDARDAAERQRQAEERAEAERLASIERSRKAAEDARLAEVERQHQEREREAEEQRKREADKKHKAKINNDAMTAFIAGGLTAEAAKLAVVLIASHKVPAVRIEY